MQNLTKEYVYIGKIKFCFIALFVVVGLTCQAFAESQTITNDIENPIPIPFRGFKTYSTVSINYDDLAKLLNLTVMELDNNYREDAPSINAKTGTRLKSTRNIHTALDSNRLYFEAFKNDEDKAVVEKIRKSIQAVPSEIAISELTMNEQLAYWLNFYNIALIEQLVDVYPKNTLLDFLYGDNSVLDKKQYLISGQKLSLNDIQNNILLTKFSYSPLVMYGMFQGVIGGPNVLPKAYTGKNVMSLLDENARLFINSNRGVFDGDENSVRVSAYYKRFAVLFPNFETDLKKHLLKYVDGNYFDKVSSAEKFVADIEDYHIADFRGGTRDFGGAIHDNPAALFDAVMESYGSSSSGSYSGNAQPSSLFSADFIAMTTKMKQIRKAKTGGVVIKAEGATIKSEIKATLKPKDNSSYLEDLQAFEEEQERQEAAERKQKEQTAAEDKH